MKKTISNKSIILFEPTMDVGGWLESYVENLINSGIEAENICLFSDIFFANLSHISLIVPKQEKDFIYKIKEIYKNIDPWYEMSADKIIHNIELLKMAGKEPKSIKQDSLLKNIFKEYQDYLKHNNSEDIFGEISMGLKNMPELKCFIIFYPQKLWPWLDSLTISEFIESIFKFLSHIKHVLIITDINDVKTHTFNIDKHSLNQDTKTFHLLKEKDMNIDVLMDRISNEKYAKSSLLLVKNYLHFLEKLKNFFILYLPPWIKDVEFQLLIFCGSFALNSHHKKMYDLEIIDLFVKKIGLSKEGEERFWEIIKKGNSIDYVIKVKDQWSKEDLKILKTFKKDHDQLRMLIDNLDSLDGNGAFGVDFFDVVANTYKFTKNEKYSIWLKQELNKCIYFSSSFQDFKNALEQIWIMTKQPSKPDENQVFICDFHTTSWQYSSFKNIFYSHDLEDWIEKIRKNDAKIQNL